MVTAEFPTFDVLGLPIAAVTPETASGIIHKWAEDKSGRFVCLRDVHGVMRAQESEELFQIHLASDMLCPDGMPIVFIGKLRGYTVEQTCGANLLDRLLNDSMKSGLRHYFYGGNKGVAKELVEVLHRQYPGVQIVGHSTPPFRALTDDEIDEFVNELAACQADVVWIGLSTPKQEYLMYRLKGRANATFLGIGAVYDFVTGRVPRAPRWMQKACLEWLFRLISEPRRLWYRYLVLAPLFVWKNLTSSSNLRRSRER